ncbi:hypothetical protein [Pinibacter aurantiacus]|uniref:Lipoprotein n=1 Tax=Pinibacter aurantiacus TaxID=2851599 RepID=A0A9E2W3T1_9BACT|nr:hypothetical protein [Pinibacter aurantiacus]MBV4357139.1 hypothetical protein [Pinibacter aurantiacus]
MYPKKNSLHVCLALLIVSATFVVISGCSAGKAALKKGDYYSACLQSIDRLRSSPTNKKAIETLKEAYPLAVNYTKQEETGLTQFYKQGNYLQVYRNYEAMSNIARNIITSPGAMKVIPYPNTYTDELNKYRGLAADESYRMGEAALNINSRESAKTAYYNFLQVQQIDPNYKDVNNKINDALWLATLKVMIDMAPISGAYQVNADFFYTQILNYTSSTLKDKFIRFYTPSEAQEYQINPDQVLQVGFYDFVVGNVYDSKNTYDVKRDSVKIGTSRDKSGTPFDVYGTVTARVTAYTRNIDSRGLLDVYITDYTTNRSLASRRFTGGYTWATSWGSFNGDERALTVDELAMIGRQPGVPPPPQQLFVEFTKPLYTQATDFIRSFYSSYQ